MPIHTRPDVLDTTVKLSMPDTDDPESAPLVSTAAYSAVDSPSKSSWYLFLLTLSIGGLQIVWSVELSNGSPYLLSLGMSKSLLAFVWIAGPLTGSLVQPYIGIRSDNCRLAWGKRKPFMAGGGVATVVSLLALAWVREIVRGLLGLFGVESGKTAVIVVATVLMYCLDFSINTVQAGIRAFIVDNAPAHQQEAANAWASRLTGVGNILGFIFGYLDLPSILPLFGDTQFKILCVIASIALSSTLLVSCVYITERDPRLQEPASASSLGLVSFFSQVFHSARRLPPQIAKVCQVQVAAWIGWFPFLFYSTTYIGQLYVNPIFDEHPDLPDDAINRAWEDATRIGALALLINAAVTFTANVVLPLLVVPTYARRAVSAVRANSPSNDDDDDDGGGGGGGDGVLPTTRSASEESTRPLQRRLSFSSMPFGTSSEPLLEPLGGKPPPPPLRESSGVLLSRLQIRGFTLRRAWLLAHLLFSTCMLSTFFIGTFQAGIVVIALVGISWAMTLWAPFALISAEVARMDEDRRARLLLRHADVAVDAHNSALHPATGPRTGADVELNGRPLNAAASETDEVADADERARTNAHAHTVDSARTNADTDTDTDAMLQAGVILGLHNVAISAPQVLSSLVSSAIFKALQKPRGAPGDDSVGWVMRFGGCATLLAAWLTTRLQEGPPQ